MLAVLRPSKSQTVCQGRICLSCVHATKAAVLQKLFRDRLVGLVVKASASGAEDPGLESRLRQDFSASSHTSDFKIGTPVVTLPGAWHCRVRAGTGRRGPVCVCFGGRSAHFIFSTMTLHRKYSGCPWTSVSKSESASDLFPSLDEEEAGFTYYV